MGELNIIFSFQGWCEIDVDVLLVSILIVKVVVA